ncbi:hypothetical protein TNCV_3389311 [Trichonephila clavipes]|nr:hypothetical protein TNCV_3389311 [Trichonephila clavipes]
MSAENDIFRTNVVVAVAEWYRYRTVACFVTVSGFTYTAWIAFGYPNNRVSERCPVPIDSDKRRSTVRVFYGIRLRSEP